MYYILSDKTRLSWNTIEGTISLFINYTVEFEMMASIRLIVSKTPFMHNEWPQEGYACALVQSIFKIPCSFVNRLISASTSVGLIYVRPLSQMNILFFTGQFRKHCSSN